MTKKSNNRDQNQSALNNEEQEVLNSFEQGEWKTVRNIISEKENTVQAATSYLQKDARINIRISSSDLNRIK